MKTISELICELGDMEGLSPGAVSLLSTVRGRVERELDAVAAGDALRALDVQEALLRTRSLLLTQNAALEEKLVALEEERDDLSRVQWQNIAGIVQYTLAFVADAARRGYDASRHVTCLHTIVVSKNLDEATARVDELIRLFGLDPEVLAEAARGMIDGE